ncbi:MAG: signal peptidase II [Chloroflexota bacterium]
MNSLARRWIFLFIIIAVVLLLDQVTKQWVISHLRLYENYQLIPALYPLFQLTRSENNGAAFGFLPQAGDLFLIVAVVVVLVMLIFYPRVPEKACWTRFALGLVLGGALGNAFDRLTHGAVIDFIHYQFLGINNVSNLADHAIVIGVLLIVLQSWRTNANKPEELPQKSGGNPPQS